MFCTRLFVTLHHINNPQLTIIMEIKNYCTGIQHIGLPTLDVEKTTEFYKSLGFEVALKLNNKGQNVVFLQLKNIMVEAYDKEPVALKAGAIEHIAIDVKNIDELYGLIKSRGYEIITPGVMSLPYWENGIKYFTILGPNKEKLEFCEKL